MEEERSVRPEQRENAITKINQSAQLKNALATLRMPGINIVSNPGGIIIAGASVGIVLTRPAKNRYHIMAVSSDITIKTLNKDTQNLGEALWLCEQLIKLDETIKARKG